MRNNTRKCFLIGKYSAIWKTIRVWFVAFLNTKPFIFSFHRGHICVWLFSAGGTSRCLVYSVNFVGNLIPIKMALFSPTTQSYVVLFIFLIMSCFCIREHAVWRWLTKSNIVPRLGIVSFQLILNFRTESTLLWRNRHRFRTQGDYSEWANLIISLKS